MEEIKILSQGERLKKIRKTLNLSQEELAGEKFSKNYISMFENDKRRISPINAIYLTQQINNFAKKKNKNIHITTTYLLKTEKDIAKDKCEKLLREVESNLGISNYNIQLNLYVAYVLSKKYNLKNFLAKSLYLKGLNSLKRELDQCAVIQFLEALTYFSKIDDFQTIAQLYTNIGVIYLKQNRTVDALPYFNLAKNSLSKLEEFDDVNSTIKHIDYYRTLCYPRTGVKS
ncbi:helix-turn-helix domain-containing protein [Thermohalobacter berrensis]|uniref:HTH cro/C1-type domain-containing protein n=1 Tax=Thermohalobacter berrensis TaxID=99594 RepID=A0A419T188_9FIRM|nr:helix-turn-helix transcriptional regulator [Thermohalobacter berrensis]RKD31189.1 hypothetical protein BET03_03415 [Thermohalobacter berrensis]